MVVYTPEERRDAITALEGSGIVPTNIDTNLAGVLRMLVSEATHYKRLVADAEADALVAAAANRELVRDALGWRSQLIAAHQVIWTLAQRTDGQIRITVTEMTEAPLNPPLVSRSDPEGMLIITTKIPDGVDVEAGEE